MIEEIRSFLAARKKLHAIQAYREGTGASILTCKAAVDQIETEMGLGFENSRPPEVDQPTSESQDLLAFQIGSGWDWARIRELEADARLLEPRDYSVFDISDEAEHRPIEVDVIIDFGYVPMLARDANNLNWWMGQFARGGEEIHCWGMYGTDLASAISAL